MRMRMTRCGDVSVCVFVTLVMSLYEFKCVRVVIVVNVTLNHEGTWLFNG